MDRTAYCLLQGLPEDQGSLAQCGLEKVGPWSSSAPCWSWGPITHRTPAVLRAAGTQGFQTHRLQTSGQWLQPQPRPARPEPCLPGAHGAKLLSEGQQAFGTSYVPGVPRSFPFSTSRSCGPWWKALARLLTHCAGVSELNQVGEAAQWTWLLNPGLTGTVACLWHHAPGPAWKMPARLLEGLHTLR